MGLFPWKNPLQNLVSVILSFCTNVHINVNDDHNNNNNNNSNNNSNGNSDYGDDDIRGRDVENIDPSGAKNAQTMDELIFPYLACDLATRARF